MTLGTVFVITLVLQTLHLICQDWLDLFPFNDIARLRETISPSNRLLVIAGNSVPSLIALGLALFYLGRATPLGVGLYWIAYFGSVVVLMYTMWYRPYFFGASAEQRQEVAYAYGRTYQLLPPRGQNPRPNTFHIVLHGLFLINAVLGIAIGFNLV